jgi:hypothetical protein
MNRALLLVLLRPPVLGRVKTRLAKGIGEEQALAVYQRLMSHTLDVAAPLPCAKAAWWSEEPLLPDPAAALGFAVRIQANGDLGERMAQAFAEGFSKGHTPVLIIGTDCPGISTALLTQAIDALNEHDAVLGPANDGGYYLLGLREPLPALFTNKQWSTSSVLAATVAELEHHGLRCYLLPELVDVDTLEDLQKVQLP